ncbi:MAG: signal peptidase I [Minisyncoccia bacterium]
MIPKKDTEQKKSLLRDFLELVRFTLLVLVIVIPLRMFVAQPFIVNGDSMNPTFANGDYLIIDEISYTRSNPSRGDVIVFRLPSNKKRFLIKRVVGLPGETVVINGSKISITKTNKTTVQLDENYLNEDFSSYGTWNLAEDEYFVMGDNRNNSSDSRSWGILNREFIVGKTFLRLFPFTTLSYTPGEFQTSDIEIALPQ